MKREVLADKLVSMIAAIQRDHPLRVGIDGVDGVGKTTLADELVGPLRNLNRRVIRASVDGFHNPASIRYRQGPLSPRGYFLDSFNYEALRTDLLNPLGPNGSRLYRTRVFDHRTDSEVIAQYERAEAGDVLLFDGIFLQRDELQGCWDFVIWVEADFETTIERALARDSSGAPEPEFDSSQLAEKYIKRYVPGQKLYIEECRPRENAHVVVKNGDLLNPELEPGSAG
ncbi:MAG TPA: uridine kinase [Blastocatellia bacterium]|nr:uridine kinase [Blastocatellia bacterium]